MSTFADLEQAAPQIGAAIRDRLERTGLFLLGTVRADGSPRVSPIEAKLVDGRLFMGMMPGSMKSLDIRREPRVCLLTPLADKDDLGGEGKLYAQLVQVTDRAAADAILRSFVPEGEHPPDALDGSPLFEADISAAAWQAVEGETWVTWSWSPSRGLRLRHRVGATGAATEIDLT